MEKMVFTKKQKKKLNKIRKWFLEATEPIEDSGLRAMVSAKICSRIGALSEVLLGVSGSVDNQVSQGSGLLPIKTAPKDGTEILGWREDCGMMLIRYTSLEEFLTTQEIEKLDLDDETIFKNDWFYADFVQGGRLEGDEVPTHWLPLPSGAEK